MKLEASAKLFVIIIKRKKRKLLEETPVINPDIYDIKKSLPACRIFSRLLCVGI